MKRILLWSCILIWVFAIPVSAHDVPDLNQTGSICVTVRYNGLPVSGGELTLYRVGDILEEDGNYSFVLTKEFAPSKVSLKHIQSPEASEKLADFARRQKIQGLTQKIDTEGKGEFTDLKPGLFLLVQRKAAQGYRCVNPFLVSIPMRESDTYTYHVDAGPKVSPSVQPENPEQPQTGQPGWPIWVFAFSAVSLTGVLWLKKRTGDE